MNWFGICAIQMFMLRFFYFFFRSVDGRWSMVDEQLFGKTEWLSDTNQRASFSIVTKPTIGNNECPWWKCRMQNAECEQQKHSKNKSKRFFIICDHILSRYTIFVIASAKEDKNSKILLECWMLGSCSVCLHTATSIDNLIWHLQKDFFFFSNEKKKSFIESNQTKSGHLFDWHKYVYLKIGVCISCVSVLSNNTTKMENGCLTIWRDIVDFGLENVYSCVYI